MIEPPASVTPELAHRARARAAGLRVALVHDWLLGMRGGEQVLLALLQLFPKAEIYTLFHNPGAVDSAINRRAIFASHLSRLPGVRRYYRRLLPFFPSTIERMRIRPGTDLVLSTSHCVAHGAAPPAGARHLTYCFTPMRYVYDQREAYAAGGASAETRILEWIAPKLRAWDRAAAQRCGNYWAISDFVSNRIEREYGLHAPVLYPPVRTELFTPNPGSPHSDPSAPYLIVSALAPYKRLDIAIEAANMLGKRLAIVGSGPAELSLRRLAGPSVDFLGWVDEPRLRELYRACSALIFPGEEDFGIVPLEAMASGKPVLALRAGGLLETHIEGTTGAFFNAPRAASLAEAWNRFDPAAYDPVAIRNHAEQFSTERFLDGFAARLGEFMDSSGRPMS